MSAADRERAPGVALVSREYPPHSGGGIGTYARHMAPALAAAGARVHIITADAPGEPAMRVDRSLTVHRVSIGSARSHAESARAFSLGAARVVQRLASSGEIDAAEFADYEGAGAALLSLRACSVDVARPGGAPLGIVVHLHTPTEALAALGSIPASRDAADIAEVIAMERAAIHGADAVCAPSSFMADWAREALGLRERPTVIPYAHGPTPGAPGAPTERRALFIGRLEARKGVESLAGAWRIVAGARPGWTLRCVGADTSGPDGRSMRARMIDALGDGAHTVEFAGALPPDDLAGELNAAALCIVPSLWENYPNTCIEAMLHGRAALVSDHGGMREMLGDSDAGEQFRAGDAPSLARALLALIDEGMARLAERGEAARERIASVCNPARMARARLDLYRLAIERARARTTLAPALGLPRGLAHPWNERPDPCSTAAGADESSIGATHRAGADAAARARAALLECARRGLTPIALYGAGTHTRALGPALLEPPVTIAAILDDDPSRQGRTLWGFPVVAPARARALGVRAVVLSSDSMERALWEASAPLRSEGIEVLRLYAR